MNVMVEGQDNLFAKPLSNIEGFVFDSKVASVFEDMIRRSVPGYATVIAMSGVIAGRYAQPNSRCYDLGCSLGATTLSMCRNVQAANCQVVAVDNSEEMIHRCREHFAAEKPAVPVDLVCADIRDVAIKAASVVALNFTLQFLPVDERDNYLKRIWEGMVPGGALILSEKTGDSDAAQQALVTELHHSFKRANGYSELEISQKRSALEEVLVTETIETHLERLQRAGFCQSIVWMQCLGFASILALK